MSVPPVDLGERMPSESTITFTSLDGLDLVGDLTIPDSPTDLGVLQVHGGGVTRHEAGFFDRKAAGLAESGVAALRFDLRGHGESGGKQEDLTLAGVLNDIQVALEELRARTVGLSKASGLELVRSALGIVPEATVAVGDGMNDIELLTWAARGVAMGHAPERLRSIADEVTGTIDEHGVVDVLRSITARDVASR